MRKTIFWLHLIAGLAAGIVIFIMSLTGVLLTYEKQLIAWADREFLNAAPIPDASRVSLQTLIAAVEGADGPQATSVTLFAQSAAAAVSAGGATYYVHVHNGELLGTGSTKIRSFFRTVTNWHRYIAMSGENRAAGKATTGAANLIFLFILVSGIVIWWRGGVLWFKRRQSAKPLYWNWHNVFGFWALIPLVLVVVSATVISYPRASDLVYRLSGVELPAQAARRVEAEGTRRTSSGESLKVSGLTWDRIQEDIPDWKTITIRISANPEPSISLTVDRGSIGQPQYRSTITVDQQSGQVSKVETFEDQNKGRRLRSWLRFVHTGEYYGLVGQGIAGIASFAGVMLVGTGFILSWYRLVGWVSRRRHRPHTATAVPRASEKLLPTRDSGYYETQTIRSSEES